MHAMLIRPVGAVNGAVPSLCCGTVAGVCCSGDRPNYICVLAEGSSVFVAAADGPKVSHTAVRAGLFHCLTEQTEEQQRGAAVLWVGIGQPNPNPSLNQTCSFTLPLRIGAAIYCSNPPHWRSWCQRRLRAGCEVVVQAG